MRAILTLPALVAATALGCGSSSGPHTPHGVAYGLRVLLIDAPFPYDSVTRVDVHIVRVMASTRSDTGGNASDSIALGLHTIAAPNRTISVLALNEGAVDSLGADSVDAAVLYRQLRVVINADLSSITLKDGTVLTSATSPGIAWGGPAEQTYGLFLDAPLAVPDTGATVIVDFNAGQSFRMVGSSPGQGFSFVPFIRAVNSALTGSIHGTVVDSASGAPVTDAGLTVFVGDTLQSESTWGVISTSRTDATGGFALPYISPGTYIVGADGSPTSGRGAVRRGGVMVTTGVQTDVGTLRLP